MGPAFSSTIYCARVLRRLLIDNLLEDSKWGE